MPVNPPMLAFTSPATACWSNCHCQHSHLWFQRAIEPAAASIHRSGHNEMVNLWSPSLDISVLAFMSTQHDLASTSQESHQASQPDAPNVHISDCSPPRSALVNLVLLGIGISESEAGVFRPKLWRLHPKCTYKQCDT